MEIILTSLPGFKMDWLELVKFHVGILFENTS